jgi:hypothetical protein
VLRTHDQAAARGAVGKILLESARRAAIRMIVSGHQDDGFVAEWQVPEPGQRLPIQCHVVNQVRQQALLLVGLRDVHLVEIDPVRLRIGR